MRRRGDDKLHETVLVRETGRYYECAIYDILLQLYLIYWDQGEKENVATTNSRAKVDIAATRDAVTLPCPSQFVNVDFRFDYSLVVKTLYVNKTKAERYEVLREPFVFDFHNFLRHYRDILPPLLYEKVQGEKNKFGLLAIFRDGRR